MIAPTSARGVRAAEIAIEDFIAVIPVTGIADLLASALVEAYGPTLAEHIANVIGRQAHMAAR
jgi:hypothetical protein